MSNAGDDTSMTVAPLEKSVPADAATATMDEAAKAAAAGDEEGQSHDGHEGQGRDQSDCDGPYICDCRLWYVVCALCCSIVSLQCAIASFGLSPGFEDFTRGPKTDRCIWRT
jgi:hypothetical protein